MFAVVHFVDDESVECVPKTWLEGQYCYWPDSNAKRKIQKMSLPDKDNWKKYRYRKIGQDYEDYELARKNLKKAEETSNLESEEESRKRKLPARLRSDSESGSETDIDSEINGKRIPPPPKIKFVQSENRINNTRTPVKKRSIDTSPLSPSPPPPSLTTKKNNPTSVKRQLLASIPIRRSPRSKTGPQSLGREKSPRRVTSTPSTCSADGYSPRRTPVPHPRPVASDSGTPATKKSGGNISELLHQVISKIDVVQQDIAVIKSHLISSVDVDVDTIESLLPQGNKLNSVGEVEEFQESLDDNSKRKLINAMASLQAGDNAGEISRAIMRSVMTNYCMSQFSGTGQKGKVAFIGTPLYKIILSAARKASKKTVSFETIKKEVLDVLRFAPYLPGGINYSRNKGKKSKNHLEEFPTDSE